MALVQKATLNELATNANSDFLVNVLLLGMRCHTQAFISAPSVIAKLPSMHTRKTIHFLLITRKAPAGHQIGNLM